MAGTLEAIAQSGAAAFYEGELAASIAREVQSQGGVLAASDLAGYRPDVFAQTRPPLPALGLRHRRRSDLRRGAQHPRALRLSPRSDPDSVGFRHLVAEALAQAFVDNFAHAADPRHVDAPLDGLASKAYAAAQAARIDLARARGAIAPGQPAVAPARPRRAAAALRGHDADLRDGRARRRREPDHQPRQRVRLAGAGPRHRRAARQRDAVVRPATRPANSIGPGRMPLYAAPVTLVFDGDAAAGALGGSGGYRIQTAILHALVNRLDHGLAPQAAIDAPRLHAEGGALEVDGRLGEDVLAGLARLGYRLRRLDGDRPRGRVRPALGGVAHARRPAWCRRATRAPAASQRCDAHLAGAAARRAVHQPDRDADPRPGRAPAGRRPARRAATRRVAPRPAD
jgi:gamma-glutamyltranspeptidase/glutathione hydrolase